MGAHLPAGQDLILQDEGHRIVDTALPWWSAETGPLVTPS
jgi:hypothetical protein